MKPLSALSIAGSDVAVAIEAVGESRSVLTVSGTACNVADAVGLGVLVAGMAVGATVTSDAACTVAIVLRRVSVAGFSATVLAPNVSRFSVQVSRNWLRSATGNVALAERVAWTPASISAVSSGLMG